MFKNLISRRKHPDQESDDAVSRNSLVNLFDSLFDQFPASRWGGIADLLNPADRWHRGWGCDVSDSENEIVVRAEAPGFEPEEIEVKMSGNQLVLEAEHREGPADGNEQLRYGRYYRTMTMPGGIEHERITAEYKNGILEVHLPKGAGSNTRRIPVQAK